MPGTSTPLVVSFADPASPPETYRPAADRVLAGDPVQSAANLFQSTDGRFNCGIWESAPGKWRVVFSENEFCHIVAGVIVVRGDDGLERTFRAGDSFVTAAGFTGTWEVVEAAKKLYAVYE